MTFSFGAGVRDSLSNFAASLGTGRDKAAHDAFTVFELGRAQIEAMYRGDWLARKVVDIVPYWLGSSRGSSDRADQITAMLHQTLSGSARAGRARA
ncbi:hypothetical protein [Lichenibacterium dinghuense]|uniref:hypothetical protein n=1 Tax=Lichenibacterium dinghuense TaxID=2895977 RepID=UPI001F1AC611|nr:hypothetical protein [Lichenibacterium sp. 6Y81]